MSLQTTAVAAKKNKSRGEYSPEALECGRRIQRELIRKQWNQSDLARATKKIVPSIERYNVSHWVRGQHLPTPVNQDALERALGLKPGALTEQLAQPNPLTVTYMPGGERVNVVMSRTMTRETWDKISILLAKEDK